MKVIFVKLMIRFYRILSRYSAQATFSLGVVSCQCNVLNAYVCFQEHTSAFINNDSHL
jgi:hypothetical protein